MKLYFAGAESPSHLERLRACGVERVAVNITTLTRRRSAKKPLTDWATKDRLGDLEWILFADSPVTPWHPALEVLDGAEVPPEMVIGPYSWAEETRIGDMDLWFLPTWDGVDQTVLRGHVEAFEGVFLPDVVVDNQRAVTAAWASVQQPPVGFLGAITGRSKGLNRFDGVVSAAWWSVEKYGETQVWATNRLVRLSAEDKLTKRQKYAQAIEALGVHVDAVLADDPAETAKLAIRSWQKLEEATRSRQDQSVVDSDTPASGRAVAAPRANGVANHPSNGRHVTLPVIGFDVTTTTEKDAEGNEVEKSTSTLMVPEEPVRKCDSCFLAATCPGYKPQHSCAYSIPVAIRSKDQLQDVLRAMVEIQTQRVLLARFGEEVTGSPEPEVGRELDRLFDMVARWKEIEDNRDTLKLSVEAHAQSGVLSRLFGSQVGQASRALTNPVSSTEVMHDVIDVE
jgi:hypothetical protein